MSGNVDWFETFCGPLRHVLASDRELCRLRWRFPRVHPEARASAVLHADAGPDTNFAPPSNTPRPLRARPEKHFELVPTRHVNHLAEDPMAELVHVLRDAPRGPAIEIERSAAVTTVLTYTDVFK
jgi:hypothetical protein